MFTLPSYFFTLLILVNSSICTLYTYFCTLSAKHICEQKGKCLDEPLSLDLALNTSEIKAFVKNNPITQSDECTKICYFLNDCNWSVFDKFNKYCSLYATCDNFENKTTGKKFIRSQAECAQGN